MDMIPPLPGSLKTSLFPPLLSQSTGQGNAKGASQVRRGDSSIHFHSLAPLSSSDIGRGLTGQPEIITFQIRKTIFNVTVM